MTECTRCRRQYQEGVRFCPVDGFAAVPVSDPYVGRQLLGQFQLLAACGRGATGTVYRAQQTSMDRLVAVKIMRADLLSDPTVVKRFVREARAGARLCHPNIATVHLVGQTEEGLPYIVMEYIEGSPLSSAVLGNAQGVPAPLVAARILHIAEQIASALAEAHDRGIVHRDLKPENILLTERRGESDIVKVVDFGIAKIVADTMTGDSQISRIGTIFGTPHYIAPEQASGGEVDARADLYALGCILFQMATGRVPFEGASGIQVLLRHLREEPPHPRALNPHLPEPLAHLILRLLAKRREDRPADADAVLVEIRNLREALRGLPQPPALSTAEVVFRGFTDLGDLGGAPPAASAEHAALPASPKSSAAAPQVMAAAPQVVATATAAAQPVMPTPTPAPAPVMPTPISPTPTPVLRQAAQDDAAEDLEAALPWWRRGRRWGALLGSAVVLGLLIGGFMAWRVRQDGLAARKSEPAQAASPVEATPALQAPEKLPAQRSVVQQAGSGKRGAKATRKRPAEEQDPEDAMLPEVHFPASGSPPPVSVAPAPALQDPPAAAIPAPAALVPPVARPAPQPAPQPVVTPPAPLPSPPTAPAAAPYPPYPTVQPEAKPAQPEVKPAQPPARPAPPPPPPPPVDDKVDPTTDPYYRLK